MIIINLLGSPFMRNLTLHAFDGLQLYTFHMKVLEWFWTIFIPILIKSTRQYISYLGSGPQISFFDKICFDAYFRLG